MNRTAFALTLAAVALSHAGCSDPAPASTPPVPAPVEPQAAPTPEAPPVAPPSVEAPPVAPPSVEPPAQVAGAPLRIPRTLLAQLEGDAVESPERGDVSVRACASGCVLLSPAGEFTFVLLQYGGSEEGLAEEIDIVRIEGGTQTARTHRVVYTPESIEAYQTAEAESAVPPWMPLLTRALGNVQTHRWAEDIVTHRATTTFSLDEVSPLVALGGPLEGRILWAEVGETAYRIHLARADGTSPRLLATLPLQPTGCDGDYTDSACVVPLSLDRAYASPDGRFLHVVVHEGVAGDFHTGDPKVLTLPLDDASALAAAITPASRREDLLRSLRAPGPVMHVWNHQDSLETRGELCDHACALFFENNEFWFVRPTRVEQAEPRAPMIFRPDGARAEVLISAGDDPETRAEAIERGLDGAPSVQGRRIVLRQANAAWEGLIHVPLVELRAPHVGAQLSMEVEGEEYVIRLRRGDAEVEVGRVPALRVNGRVSPPSIVEVFAPPVLGSPLIVLGAAATRLPSSSEGVEHTYFHAVLTLP